VSKNQRERERGKRIWHQKHTLCIFSSCCKEEILYLFDLFRLSITFSKRKVRTDVRGQLDDVPSDSLGTQARFLCPDATVALATLFSRWLVWRSLLHHSVVLIPLYAFQKVQRVTYRRRHSYNTKSNRTKIVKTPGNKLTVHYRKKRAGHRRCGDCGCKLQGVRFFPRLCSTAWSSPTLHFQMPRIRANVATNLSKRHKTVTRPYGGTRCGGCVRQR